MKKWVRNAFTITVGLGLFSSNLSPSIVASAESAKQLQNVSAIEVSSPHLQSKLDQMNEKALSDDTFIIKYTKPLSPAEHRMAGGTLVTNIPSLNYAVVKVKNKKDLQKVMLKYRSLAHVNSVNPSALYKPASTPDPKVSEQYFIEMLKLNQAHKLAGKNTVTVAVIDQGVDMQHPELKGKLLPSYNAVNPMNQGTPDFHGTHVAGIIAGNKDNGIGGFGVNPNVKILPIDVFDRSWGAYDYAIAQGILHAVEKNAKVINMSLSGPMKSPLIEEAIKKAREKNITIVAAAGNTGDTMVGYPAAFEGVISVGSVDKSKKLSSFSSYGSSVDIVAPGDEIYSTIYESEKKSSFREMSGTSMASPMVAGVASLLLSKYPNLTPTQIEYILEHTADDLGDPGFDIKYGNGLVNPVAALNYDIKKLPAFITKPFTDKDIAENATAVDLTKTSEVKGAITKPFEEKWYSAEVKKGEYVQLFLEGSKQYDYKLMINLQSQEGKDKLDVNDVMDGKVEGKLYKVPYTGTLYFGVKDVNGNYDDSNKQQSKFTLAVKKYSVLPEDESTFEKPIQIEVPYDSSKEKFTLIGDEGDNDYFTFTVEEEQVIKIDLSGIPGVDTSLSVYEIFKMPPPEEGEAAYDFEIPAMKEDQQEPTFYANSKGKSEGETLSFLARPGTEYFIKVSNKVSNYFGIFDFFMNWNMLQEKQTPESSAIPYVLKVQGKVLPPDEDSLPLIHRFEEGSTLEKQRELLLMDPVEEEIDYTEVIKNNALPYNINDEATGYLQSLEDEDWFTVTPGETGIYEFTLDAKDTTVPIFSMYQIRKEKDRDGKEFSYMEQIASNEYSFWMNGRLDERLYTGFKKNETYFIKLNSNYYNQSLSFDPYKFTSKLIVKNPQDKYEDNDKFEEIKNLPANVIEGNFAMPYDQDNFYYESKSDDIYGMTLERKQVSDQFKAQYPKELLSPFYGMMVVYEDTNKNRKLDDEEIRTAQYMERGAMTGKTYGSFRMEKGKNYIFSISAYFDWPSSFSLIPYVLSINPVNKNDEDKGSVVKNNIPSKPIELKTISANHLQAVGHLNAGVPYGDEDWYVLKLDKATKGKIELEAGIEIDGVISLYKDGKLIATADYYPEGDNEILNFNLTKGTYHIKVRDVNGNATLNPYTLNVYK
ncbi:S8 family serine peptidase [Bacillus sp. S/N-304-OC-R1]|uniref:S8 family peptidase n=1 Tax=Bacillus sp. S/N-304-OC-R1 TaxID=2758034 RepID=UPI001C8DFB60|nr:S8 family serine peptidase [Bacillus sp. S/N-304-OC-R1]MBY0123509.1 S8 family serine peptidase [Bacillus sp. S/N-304-OC-R1]